jgi:hypothetical protein
MPEDLFALNHAMWMAKAFLGTGLSCKVAISSTVYIIRVR